MKDILKSFFESEKIEYYSVLSYKDCRVIRQDIMARESFIPKSIVVFLIPYYAGHTVNISNYAAAKDYHIYVKEITQRLSHALSCKYPDIMAKGYGDHSPIDERHAALCAGLGVLGENGLLINEKYGSYVFIAELICDAEPSDLGAIAPMSIESCIGCGKCKKACPTGRLENKTMSCLSEITQKRGELSEDEIKLMKEQNTVWGCDVCQLVCPNNFEPAITPIPFFREARIEELTEELLSKMDKSEFSERAFSWRGRKTVERNLKL